MDNNPIQRITTSKQMFIAQQLYHQVLTRVAQYTQQRRYKAAYTELSRFLQEYDCYNQMHLNDRVQSYSKLIQYLLKIIKQRAVRDMARKNKIEQTIQTKTIEVYIRILNVLAAKYYVNISFIFGNVQTCGKEMFKWLLKDQLIVNEHVKRDRQYSILNREPFDQVIELQRFYYLLQQIFRWNSYYSNNRSLEFAQAALQISQQVLELPEFKHKWYIHHMKNATNTMNKMVEHGYYSNAVLFIDQINKSKLLDLLSDYLWYLEYQQNQKGKHKIKIRLNHLIKQLLWFWLQTINVYEHNIEFARCYYTIQFLKWLSSNYLRSKDEIYGYIQAVSSNKFLKYKEELAFVQEIEYLTKEQLNFGDFKKIKEQKEEQARIKQQEVETALYYYQNQAPQVGEQFITQGPRVQVQQPKRLNELPYVELTTFQNMKESTLALENASSVETRQSSHASRVKRISTVQLTARYYVNKEQVQAIQEPQRQHRSAKQSEHHQCPSLDRVFETIIDNKLQIPTLDVHNVNDEINSIKDNNFYKKILQMKQDYDTLYRRKQYKQKEQLKNEFQSSTDFKLSVQRMQFAHQTTATELSPKDNISLLSFEKPGKLLTALQKLKKIIFSHPEVFCLTRLRNQFKEQKKWYKKKSSILLPRPSQHQRLSVKISMYQRYNSQEEIEDRLKLLRLRSQQQLAKNVGQSECNLAKVTKELSHKKRELQLKTCGHRATRSETATINLDKLYMSLSRSIKKPQYL